MSKLTMYGPSNSNSDAVHAEKYRSVGEDFRGSAGRIAAAITDSDQHYHAFRDHLLHMKFSPPGRVWAGAGMGTNVTLYNCFVMGTIHDSFVDGPTDEELASLGAFQHPSRSIMHTGVDAATSMRQGGGVGYDVSTLRPRGDVIRGVNSNTDGPLAFAPIYDAVCRATSSAGNRRGAQMLVMRIDHPDIVEFIQAKQAMGNQAVLWNHVKSLEDGPEKNAMMAALFAGKPLTGFNMSIAVTDEFMEHLVMGKPFMLRFKGQDYREVDPAYLWDMIMRGTYDWAEPGVLFIDTINRMNNLHYCETIAATNPCGEQPLPPYGACLLGSWNLTKFLVGEPGNYSFDLQSLLDTVPDVVRAMDNVVDVSRYPLILQEQEAKNKRRMGLGVTGLANAIEALGFPYGTPEFVAKENEILEALMNHCYQASALLAKEKGAFPAYHEGEYMKSETVKGLWPETQDMIRKYGIRNSHLTSIAPTGTISFCMDNVSSGVEPVIAYEQSRRIIMKAGDEIVTVPDYGVARLGVHGRTVVSNQISASEHVAVLAAAQKNVDSAVSKTVNVPANFDFGQFKGLYLEAYDAGCKGLTTYRPADNFDEPIKAVPEDAAEEPDGGACGWDPVTGQRTGACAE